MTHYVIPFRPAALPAIGYRVDVHQIGEQAIVILFQNRCIAKQTQLLNLDAANAKARELADDHGCSVIHHRIVRDA